MRLRLALLLVLSLAACDAQAPPPEPPTLVGFWLSMARDDARHVRLAGPQQALDYAAPSATAIRISGATTAEVRYLHGRSVSEDWGEQRVSYTLGSAPVSGADGWSVRVSLHGTSHVSIVQVDADGVERWHYFLHDGPPALEVRGDTITLPRTTFRVSGGTRSVVAEGRVVLPRWAVPAGETRLMVARPDLQMAPPWSVDLAADGGLAMRRQGHSFPSTGTWADLGGGRLSLRLGTYEWMRPRACSAGNRLVLGTEQACYGDCEARAEAQFGLPSGSVAGVRDVQTTTLSRAAR